MADFRGNMPWQLLCLEFKCVEINEVIYEGSPPRVHAYRAAGSYGNNGVTRGVTSPRAQRRKKEGIAHQHEIGRPSAGDGCPTRAAGSLEVASKCHFPKDTGNTEKLCGDDFA